MPGHGQTPVAAPSKSFTRPARTLGAAERANRHPEHHQHSTFGHHPPRHRLSSPIPSAAPPSVRSTSVFLALMNHARPITPAQWRHTRSVPWTNRPHGPGAHLPYSTARTTGTFPAAEQSALPLLLRSPLLLWFPPSLPYLPPLPTTGAYHRRQPRSPDDSATASITQ